MVPRSAANGLKAEKAERKMVEFDMFMKENIKFRGEV